MHPSHEIDIRPVTRANWPDLERLFEAPGGPKYCWCMTWREMPDRAEASNADRRAALHDRVEASVPIGLLAYLDGEPAGWCSVAPRSTFRPLVPGGGNARERPGHAAEGLGHAEEAPEPAENIWSITCFFIPRKHRRTGLAGRLLDAAVEHSFQNGADLVEAYPVDPDSPSYRFMGFVEMFRRRGFAETGMAGSRRHIMRLTR